jgi:transcriptional regulator with XRE-family HTH domain
MTIGPRVRERRKGRGLSQERLASRAGLTWSAVQRLEAGQVTDPHYSTLSSIADVLDTTIADLVGEEPAAPKEPAELLKEPAPLGEAPFQGSEARRRAAAEGHLTIRRAWGDIEEDLAREQIEEILQGVQDGRISVKAAARLLVGT